MHRSAVVGLVVFVLAATVSASGLVVAGEIAQESSLESSTIDDPVSQAEQNPSPAQFRTTDSMPSIGTASASVSTAQITEEFDSTRFEITIYEDGTATWTFRHERHLETQDERQDFRSFAEEFEEEETDFYVRYKDMAEAMTATGSDHTERDMEARDFNRTADVEYRPNAMGVVEITFTWTNFATVDDGTVVVDIFEDGLYISSNQTLVISPGDDLVFASVHPEGEYPGTSLEAATSVSWTGEREFLDGQPRVILETPSDEDESESGVAPPESDGANWLLVGGLLAVLGLGVVAAFAWYRTRSDDTRPAPTTDTSVDTTNVEAAIGSAERSDDGSADTDTPSPIPDEELMTDEDRVVSLIRQNGGRMKQVNIVEETGWSKSKVSMLLSEMEDEGTISKLRVGRENIISLEGFEPEATKSPFEE